jgi:Zn-dependent protease with chaperone function
VAAEPHAHGSSRSLRRLVWAPAIAALAAVWVFTAVRLWSSSTVPDDLELPHLDTADYFSAAFLEKASDYERFLRIDFVLSTVVTLVVLALYAAYGARFTRESAAGRVGTGMLLGMLAFAFVWIARLPFDVAALWWERRHHISKQGYLDVVVGSFFGLGGEFLFVCLAIGIVMGLARLMRRRWWIAAAPVLMGLGLVYAFVSPYMIMDLHSLRNPKVAADARAIARAQGVSDVPVKVQKVRKYTTAPNAEAAGIGPSRRVILWDTLLDGRFDRKEVRSVVAHEFGHIKRNHVVKGVGWFALVLVPTAFLIALVTNRRGGIYRPEAVPLAVFALVAISLVTTPLQNVVSRHVEAEADWFSLEATCDPAAARGAEHELAIASLNQPRPPGWAHLLFDTHPATIDRIAMARAWEGRSMARRPVTCPATTDPGR